MEEFKLDVSERLQKQLCKEEMIKRAVNIEDIKESVFIHKMVPIPYTPPVSVWKPSTATLHAFAKNCIKAILP